MSREKSEIEVIRHIGLSDTYESVEVDTQRIESILDASIPSGLHLKRPLNISLYPYAVVNGGDVTLGAYSRLFKKIGMTLHPLMEESENIENTPCNVLLHEIGHFVHDSYRLMDLEQRKYARANKAERRRLFFEEIIGRTALRLGIDNAAQLEHTAAAERFQMYQDDPVEIFARDFAKKHMQPGVKLIETRIKKDGDQTLYRSPVYRRLRKDEDIWKY